MSLKCHIFSELGELVASLRVSDEASRVALSDFVDGQGYSLESDREFTGPAFVESLEELSSILPGLHVGVHCFDVVLGGGARSVKEIKYSRKSDTFFVTNRIDGSKQRFRGRSILDPKKSHVGEAMAKRAFIWRGPV